MSFHRLVFLFFFFFRRTLLIRKWKFKELICPRSLEVRGRTEMRHKSKTFGSLASAPDSTACGCCGDFEARSASAPRKKTQTMGLEWVLPLENQSFVCLWATVPAPIMRSETSQERDRKKARRIHRSSYCRYFFLLFPILKFRLIGTCSFLQHPRWILNMADLWYFLELAF